MNSKKDFSEWTRLPTDRELMAGLLIERMRERYEGWKVFPLKEFFPLTRLKYPAIIGSFAWTSQQIKRKWVMEQQSMDFGAGWVTPGDVARDYIAIKYPDRRVRMTTDQYNKCVKDKRSTPLYCDPVESDDLVYVDIVSAYWSIVQTVGWDVNYNPSKFLCVQSEMSDFPFPRWKMTRNCLVSVGLPSSMRYWDGAKLTFHNKPNRFINLMLWRLVCDVLNGVALDAVRAGARYVYTDGFICERENFVGVCDAIGAWGLPYSIKREGSGRIHAPAEYEIGGYKTKVRPRKRPIYMDKVYDPDNEWLRPRFYRFAQSRLRTT